MDIKKLVVVLLCMLFISASFPTVLGGKFVFEPTLSLNERETSNDKEAFSVMIPPPVRSSRPHQTFYVNTSAIMRRSDLTDQQKNALIQIIIDHIKENYEPVVGAANITVTNNVSYAGTANRTVNIDPGAGNPPNSAWGEWYLGSKNSTVFLGVFMNDSSVNHAFKNANGTWNVTKLGNALGHTAGHELGHTYSVGHNNRKAPVGNATDNRSKMTRGGNINETTRAKTRFPLDNTSADIIRNNWGKPPCKSVTHYKDSVLMSHYWGPPSYTTNLPDEWGTMDVSLTVTVENPGWYSLGFLGVDTDNGVFDGNADFDFVYKSSLGIEDTDAELISFIRTNHDTTQWLLRGTHDSPYPGEWFMLDDSQITLSNFVARADGLLVARTVDMHWVEQGVHISFDTLCFGEYSNPYNGFTYGLYTPPQPPVETTLLLHQGWNQISFTVQPDDMMMSTIFQDLIDDETLIIVRDGGVGVLYPQYNIDTIGEMYSTQGYRVKVSQDVIVSVVGTPVSLPVYIPLRQGWSLIGYPLFESRDALSVLQPLIDQEVLIHVLDGDNNRVYYDGVSWVNEIGDFKPGNGYYVKVTQETFLAVHPSAPSSPEIIGPMVGVVDEPLLFIMGGSAYSEQVLLQYEYDMGDGFIGTFELYPGEIIDVEHIYSEVGDYVISLSVIDPVTLEEITSYHEISIVDAAPVLRIAEVYYNTENNIENQFIDIYVAEETVDPIDISGWYVTTFDGTNHYLPYVASVDTHDYICIRPGVGVSDLDASNGEATIYLGLDEPFLNTVGDQLALFTSEGLFVDYMRYGGGSGGPVLGNWDPTDPGPEQSSVSKSIQMHGIDRYDSSNWVSATPSAAQPNIFEFLMNPDTNLWYQIHNGVSHPINLSMGDPLAQPGWDIQNVSGPLNMSELENITEFLDHTYKYMTDRGMGEPQTNAGNNVTVRVTKGGTFGGTADGPNGAINVDIGNMADFKQRVMNKRLVEHEHVHLFQYKTAGGWGPSKDWSDLEGMAEYWSIKITMDNFNLTFEEYLAIYDELFAGAKHDTFLDDLDRDFFDNFPTSPPQWDYYWANHMFLRWIEEQYGESKVNHIFRVRNVSAGITGMIKAVQKAFEEQGHNISFEDLFRAWALHLYNTYQDKIKKTFDQTVNVTIIEIPGTINPWGTDVGRIKIPDYSDPFSVVLRFEGASHKNYSITIIGINQTTTHRFKGNISLVYPGTKKDLIIIIQQINCHEQTAYTLRVIPSPITFPSRPQVNGPNQARVNNIVGFEIGGSIYEGPGHLDYCVDWGDGSIEWFTNVPSGEFIDVVHNWMEIGDYVISCYAVAEGGLESEIATHEIKVIPAPPSPPELMGPTTGVVNIPVWFTMGGSNYSEPVLLNYTFDMGDGYTGGFELSPGDLTEINHTYYSVGEYVVTVTVYDPVTGDGISTMQEIEIIPAPPSPPVIIGPEIVYSGELAVFSVGGSEYAENIELSYQLLWGDYEITIFELYPGDMIDLEHTWFVEEDTAFLIQLNVYDPYTLEEVSTLFYLNVISVDIDLFPLILYDDYGDGWNGGYIDIYVNGVLMYDGITLESGFLGYMDIIMTNADLIHISYTPGDLPWENSYEIYNQYNTLMFSDGMDGTVPTGGSFVADSYTMSPPGFPVIDGPSIGYVDDVLLFTVGGSLYYPWTDLFYMLDWGDGDVDYFTLISGDTIMLEHSWMIPGDYVITLTVFDPYTFEEVSTLFYLNVISVDIDLFPLILYDSYGDGWNGGYIDIYVNGVLMYDGITLETGEIGYYMDIFMTNADFIEIFYTPGNWPWENGYEIYNQYNTLLFSDGMDGNAPMGGSFVADSYTMSPPGVPVIDGPSIGFANNELIFSVGGSLYYPWTDLSYVIDWGDGDVDYFTLISGDTIMLEHSWMIPDEYVITLTVFDPMTGEDVSTMHDITILPEGYGCMFTISLYDDFGDGWNGGMLDVFVNDILTFHQITLENGYGPEEFFFFAESGDVVEFVYTPGMWSWENSYAVTDFTGAIVFEDGMGGTTPTGGFFIASCSGGYIPPTPPTLLGPVEGFSGEYIQFFIGGSFGISGLVQYVIDWGDGSFFQTPYLMPGEMIEVWHIWDNPGYYTIIAWAETDDGMISDPIEHFIIISEWHTKQKQTLQSLIQRIP